MTNPYLLGTRLYFSIYRGRNNRNYLSKLLTRHCAPRHLLRSGTLSLRPINRGSVCYYGGAHPLIPAIYWLYLKPNYNKNSILSNIYRGKHNIFPTTFLRPIRHTTTILRLSRCFYPMKHNIFNWINHLYSSSTNVPVYCVGGTNM